MRSPWFSPTSRFGAWLVSTAPELRILAFIVGGFLVIGFLMGFDLPKR